MARKSKSAAAETLEEIQSAADQLADWIREHLGWVVGGIAVLLVGSGLISWAASQRGEREEQAQSALFEARSDFLSSMGAGWGAYEVPELANPEAATQILAAWSEALASISDEYPGTTAAFLARLETGSMLDEDGKREAALALYDELAAEDSQVEALRGLATQRAAQVLEDLERWADAAARHESAAALDGYPLRHWALADAARTHAAAGDASRAAELYRRLEDEAPGLRLSDAQRARARELQALARES